MFRKWNSTSAILWLIILAGQPARAQCQRQKVLASDAQPGDRFGTAVAMTANWAAVGAPSEDSLVVSSGAIYMFQRVGTDWIQTQKLKASDPVSGGGFGAALSMVDGVLVAGAYGTGSGGVVYVFEQAGDTWTQTARLETDDADSEDAFGACVSTTGNRILAAAPSDGEHSVDSGAAYIFDRVGTNWVQTSKLMGADTGPFDAFGTSVSLLGDRAVVGDVHKKEGQSYPGVVYVFELGPGGWTQTQKLSAADAVSGDYFGVSVALVGSAAVIGAGARNGCAPGGGGIYKFDREATGWTQQPALCPDDASSGDQFGLALAVSGDRLLSSSNVGFAGSACDFKLSGGQYVRVGKLLASDAAFSDCFGFAFAVSGSTAIVGASGVDDACTNDPNCDSGAAYVFQLAESATQFGHCPTAAPCNNVDAHGGCRNSTGQGAVLAACGSGSVATDDLQVEVTHCPANKLTLLYMGGGQVHVPFADGFRDVSGGGVGVFRFGGLSADPQGRAMRGPGLVAQSQAFHNTNGHIQAGQTWNFQVWYRDTAGPCHGLTNYSNGLQIAFAP